MKLHLPKLLLTAVLAAFVPTIYGADSISLNFYASGQTVGSNTEGTSLFGVDVTDWNDITTSSVKAVQTQYLTVTSKDEKTATLVLTTPQPSYKSNGSYTNPLEDKLMSSYLDISSNNASSKWNVHLESDMWFADVTLYLAGDGGYYTPVVVNGVSYIGGVDNKKPDEYGSTQGWGDRNTNTDGSKSYSTAKGYDGSAAISDADLNNENAVRVNNVFGGAGITIYNEAQASGSNRATLAGLQFVDTTDEVVYTSTLGANATLSDVTWSKQGVEETTKLGDIAPADSYLSVTAAAAGSTLSIGDAATIAGLHLAANNLTVTGSTLTTGALHAKSGSILTMEAGIAGENLVLSGLGTIALNSVNYTGNVNVNSGTTVQLLSNTKVGGSFSNKGVVYINAGSESVDLNISNSGTVHINAGSESVHLNDLIDQNQGAYNPAFVTNTAAAKLVIDHSGNKTLNGNITIANGGRVILKGGTLGTADTAITDKINAEAGTILVLDGVQAYVSSKDGKDQLFNVNLELINGTTLNLLANDRLNWGGGYTTTIGLNSALNVSNTRQSLSGGAAIVMDGGVIYGIGGAYNNTDDNFTAGLDFHQNGTIKVTSNSTIATAVASRAADRNVTINVDAGATLTIGSYSVGDQVFTGALVGNGGFTKEGAGALVYNGAAFTNNLTISAGEFVYNGDTLKNNITVNGGKFVYNGDKLSQDLTLTLNGGEFIYSGAAFTRILDIAGGVFEYVVAKDTSLDSFITGAGTFRKSGAGTLTLSLSSFMDTTDDDTTISLDVAQGKMVVNAAVGEYEKTISGAAGTELEKIGKGTLKTNGSNFAGHILVSEGTLQLTAAMEKDNRTMTVANGATLDVNGKAAYYNLTLQEGATLTNSVESGNDSGTGKKQFHRITLEGTATVSGKSDFGMVGSGWHTSFLGMQGNTLIKEGGNTFFLVNTTVSSAGTIQVDDGTLLAMQKEDTSGVLDISKLSVKVNKGGKFQLSGSSESIQDLNLAGGELVVDNGHTLTTAGTTTMNGGKVTGNLCLSGAIILAGGGAVDLSEAVLSGTTLTDFKLVPTSEETPRTSGLQSLTYTLWSGDGTVISTQDSIVIEGKTYTMDSLTGTFVTEGDIFYVAANDAVTVGGAGFTEDTDKATVFVVDGSLHVAGKPANDITINLQESSTLTTSAEGDIGSITLAGNGLYDMGAYTKDKGVIPNVMVSGLGDSAKWTGTVRLSGKLPDGADLNSYGNANSKIEMVGVSGWLKAVDLSTSSRLILTKETEGDTERNGLTIIAASTKTYSFLGGVQGEGDFEVKNGGDGSPIYTFGGDLSEWSGLFHVSKTNKSDGGTVTLNLRNGGTLFTDAEAGVKLSATGGTLNVNIGSAAAETEMNGSITRTGSANLNLTVQSGSQLVTFNGGVNATTLNVQAGTTFNGAVGVTNMHVHADTVMNGGLTASNMLSVHAGKLTLGGAVSYTIASIDTSAGGEIYLGAGANLTLSTVLPNGYMGSNTGNNNEKASLELNISSAADSKNILNLQLDNMTGWEYNNTVKLTSLTGNKTVDEVHVSGALAADVFSGTAKTNLGGAKLVMSDESHLVMRKSGANAVTDFGASSIELKGTTTMDLYGDNANSTRTLTSDISGGTLKTAMNGAGKLTGALNLAALEVGSTKLVLGGTTEKKLGSVSVLSGKTLEVESGSSLQLVDSAKNTGVTFSAGTDKAATMMGTNGKGTLTQLQDATAYTIADMTLSNVTVSAATSGTAVNLTNVKADAVQLEKGSYTMTDVAKVGEYIVEDSTASFTTDLLSGITLNNADSSATLVVDLGDLGSLAGLVYGKTYNLTITLSGFTMDYEAGTGLLFAADSWLGQLLAEQGTAEYVSGSLETPVELASNTTVTVQYAGMTGEGGANVGTIITITGLSIPEPTTTTLSLLALCGLVARRRRK